MEVQGLVEKRGEVIGSIRSIPSDHEMMVYHTMAEQAVSSKMYKGIGDKSAVMMIMLSARELGIPPMQALNGGINIIQGKVEISARMMSALIRKAGHQLSILESTETSCKLLGKRQDTKDTASVSYTLEEAKKAGLVKVGGGWTKNPLDMCFARAMSRIARQLFSDVIGMGYVEGEIKASEQAPIMPDDVPRETPEEAVVVDEAEIISNFVNFFDKEDQFLALEYLKVVQKHFGWTVIEAIAELMTDQKKLMDRFQTWKSKFKTSEET